MFDPLADAKTQPELTPDVEEEDEEEEEEDGVSYFKKIRSDISVYEELLNHAIQDHLNNVLFVS